MEILNTISKVKSKQELYREVNGQLQKFYEYQYTFVCLDNNKKRYITLLARDKKHAKEKIKAGIYQPLYE